MIVELDIQAVLLIERRLDRFGSLRGQRGWAVKFNHPFFLGRGNKILQGTGMARGQHPSLKQQNRGSRQHKKLGFHGSPPSVVSFHLGTSH